MIKKWLCLSEEVLKEDAKADSAQMNEKYTIHPVTSILHYKVSRIINEFNPSSLLDMGGVGKMSGFLSVDITDANILNGFDCLKLPFRDKNFDVSCSVATVEHVDDIKKFFSEAERVSRIASVHWFPCGDFAKVTEDFKKSDVFSCSGNKNRYLHPCVIPSYYEISEMGFAIENFINVREHLLLLATIYDQFNSRKVFDFIDEYGDNPYGIIAIKKY